MFNKILRLMQKICDILEIFIAGLVVIALFISIIKIFPEFVHLWKGTNGSNQFLIFLAQIFNFVVGIEFIKLLCKPNTDNTFEVLIFLVARHMIIGKNSSLDMFLSIIGIAVLCVVRHIIHQNKRAALSENANPANSASNENSIQK